MNALKKPNPSPSRWRIAPKKAKNTPPPLPPRRRQSQPPDLIPGVNGSQSAFSQNTGSGYQWRPYQPDPRRSQVPPSNDVGILQSQLDECKREKQQLEARIAEMEIAAQKAKSLEAQFKDSEELEMALFHERQRVQELEDGLQFYPDRVRHLEENLQLKCTQTSEAQMKIDELMQELKRRDEPRSIGVEACLEKTKLLARIARMECALGKNKEMIESLHKDNLALKEENALLAESVVKRPTTPKNTMAVLELPKSVDSDKDRIITSLSERLRLHTLDSASCIEKLSLNLKQAINEKEQLITHLHNDPCLKWTRNILQPITAGRGDSCPPEMDQRIWTLFCEADPNRTGVLDAEQLETALSHGPWPQLSIRACIWLIKCYDPDSQFMTVESFSDLWGRLNKYKAVFLKHHQYGDDEFQFGYILDTNLRTALTECGVKVHDTLVNLIIERNHYDNNMMGWEDFVSIIGRLSKQFSEFRLLDRNGDQYVTLWFEDFLDVVNQCYL